MNNIAISSHDQEQTEQIKSAAAGLYFSKEDRNADIDDFIFGNQKQRQSEK